MRRAALALALAAAGAGAAAEPLPCSGSGISVEAQAPALAERICRIAVDTAAFLSRCGLPLGGAVEIRVVPTLPEGCTGLYHCGEGYIEVTDPASLAGHRAPDTRFAAIPTAAYFDSIVAHEIAHAAMDAVPCPFGTCEVTEEYVAYATQIATLPEAARTAFFAAEEVGPARRADLSLALLKLAPDLFAAKAARHFAERPDSCGYLATIGRGEIVLDRERP